MKISLIVLTLITASLSFANEVRNSKISLAPSEIDKVIRLVDKKDPGSSQKKLSFVVTDHGMSTDVSPRYTVYMGYASLAEMGNMSADFKITDQALSVVSATRIEGGIYNVVTTELREVPGYDGEYAEAILTVTYKIDAREMFSAEKDKREKCGGDFCDGEITSKIKITESIAQ